MAANCLRQLSTKTLIQQLYFCFDNRVEYAAHAVTRVIKIHNVQMQIFMMNVLFFPS